MRVIGWEDTLDSSQGEFPPEWMWPFPDELKLWFEDVVQSRKERFGDRDDDNMIENEAAPPPVRR